MGSRRPPAPLAWAALLVLVAACLTYLNGVAAAEEAEEANCTSHTNCTSCLNDTLNYTCFWLECKDTSLSGCQNQTHEGCANKTLNQCLADPTIAPSKTSTTAPGTSNTSFTISPQVTTISANTSGTTAAIPGTPSPHKSTFDASSFIGGIVLVLGLQAVIFFLYKFCKSKDQNYHTL